MSLSVCPIALVRCPAERVWALLANPERYDEWWSAKMDAIVPPGPARPGQEIRGHGRALGRDRHFHITVLAVDEARFRIQYASTFPFGISLHNDIHVTAVNAGTAEVSFG